MSKRPVLLLAAMFCVGILSGEVKSAILLAGFLIFYAKPWKEKGIRKAVFAAGLPLLFFLGILCMCRESAFRQSYLGRMQDENQVRLAGRVTRMEEKTRCFYYYLTDCTISLSGQHMQTNDAIAYVSSDEYSIGQILIVEGTISLFDAATNEGAFDARQFYQSQKIDFGIWVERVIAVRGKEDRYRMFLENIRQRLKNNIESCMKDGGVLSAMILGEKSGLDAEVKSLYQKAGISHILAISGVKTLKLDIPLVPEIRINWAFVPLHIAIIYILKLCLDEEIIPRCRFPCSRGYFKKCINWQNKKSFSVSQSYRKSLKNQQKEK